MMLSAGIPKHTSVLCFALVLVGGSMLHAQTDPATTQPAARIHVPTEELLRPEQWREVEKAVDGGLSWMVRHQKSDGSFEGSVYAQPAITGLGVMGFLAAGHPPEKGPHGQAMARAVDYILDCQHADGLFCRRPIEPKMVARRPSHTAAYIHPISAMALAEVYGMATGDRADTIRKAVDQAIRCSLRLQKEPSKKNPRDEGGWRYVRRWLGSDSDLSVTSWELMFLRSAKNAGFEVPAEPIDRAVGFVKRCYRGNGMFVYGLYRDDYNTTAAMVGAGILSLALGGKHAEPMVLESGDWILNHRRNMKYPQRRYFYNSFYCTQAMHQLGGNYWATFFPHITAQLLKLQESDGSWPHEPEDEDWGKGLPTALNILILSTPNELLPIFQR